MKQTRIILQARTSSKRLPGKVLLPVCGIPLAILAAQRAGNTGLPVVVATSEEASDDLLAKTLSDHDINFVRGPLDDVHQRFLLASRDLNEDDWIVRLTGDNPFPDGRFIEAVIQQAQERDLSYLGTDADVSGLPYGLSCEVFRVSALRSPHDELTDFDREHVTPPIRKDCGVTVFEAPAEWKSGQRCTVDTLDDYLNANRAFKGVTNPVTISAQDLVLRLSKGDTAEAIRKTDFGPLSAFTLGTAQLGIENYGRTNRDGRPGEEECLAIVKTALEARVTHFDCARAYGSAEENLRQALAKIDVDPPRIITKLDPLADLPPDEETSIVEAFVNISVFRSCAALVTDSLDVLMLHRWSHRHSHAEAIWSQLLQLQEARVISELGASISTLDEAIEALEDPAVLHLQIPCHLGDHRWSGEAFLNARAKRPEVSVYGRSCFLQGVLLSPPEDWPVINAADAREICEKLDRFTTDFNRESRADLCLAYARGCGAIDSVVVGQETQSQLLENLALAQNPPLNREECQIIREELPVLPISFLDPSQWPPK